MLLSLGYMYIAVREPCFDHLVICTLPLENQLSSQDLAHQRHIPFLFLCLVSSVKIRGDCSFC